MTQLNPDVALRRIESFTKRFGKAHLYLAYHAAFPLALTPDLLYYIWANFQQDIYGEVLGIPWVAVGDLLLSSICDEVGYELYEMDLAVRDRLLRELQSDRRFGKQRINQLSNFLLEYIQNQLYSPDPDIQDFAKTQQWIALAYTEPTQAARELALAFSKLDRLESAELLRMASLTETFAEPLSDFQPLLIYARGMGKFARGNLQAAKTEFSKALKRRKQIKVARVSLPIPEEIISSSSSLPPLLRGVGGISRRQFLELLGFAGIGLVTALVTREFSQSLPTFSFETLTVNAQGEIIDRRDLEAKYFVEPLGNNVTLEMVQIPGGTFTMGSPPGEAGRSDAEGPQHEVTLTEFFMGKFPVTQAQYEEIMGENPSRFNEENQGENRPVETVSWNNAMEFCRRLSQRTGRTYRLPSEAEWEYACRARTTTPFHFGATITTDLANYNGSSIYASEPTGEYRQQTVDVENFSPNSFGLYQMHGNIWEWCLDTWHDNYKDAPSDGSAWIGSSKDNRLLSDNERDSLYDSLIKNIIGNERRVLRGGSWGNYPENCRSASRNRYLPVYDDDYVYDGFRLVCGGVPSRILQ